MWPVSCQAAFLDAISTHTALLISSACLYGPKLVMFPTIGKLTFHDSLTPLLKQSLEFNLNSPFWGKNAEGIIPIYLLCALSSFVFTMLAAIDKCYNEISIFFKFYQVVFSDKGKNRWLLSVSGIGRSRSGVSLLFVCFTKLHLLNVCNKFPSTYGL